MKPKKQSYDRIAKVFDFLRTGDMLRWSSYQKTLFDNLSGNVLYVGIGTGLEIVNFPPKLNISAIDLSFQMLRRSEKRIENYKINMLVCF